DFCQSIVSYSAIPLDIHLMVENPDAFIPVFAAFTNSIITIHPETSYHPLRTIELIKSHGAVPGIAVDPALPVEAVRHLLPGVGQICIMTVNPGYAGQSLAPGALEKIKDCAQYLKFLNLPIDIEVDGNVSWDNIPKMLAAGANVLVTGSSSLFEKGKDRQSNFNKLKEMITDFG
ncbi:MAG: ribulose-phosphate 3-epimerase, partial [Spirochaetota bacterium]